MDAVWQFIVANKEIILVALLAVSEVLGSIDYFKSSSIFQLIVNLLKKFSGKSA
jgi:hypothetical protein